MTGGFRQNAGLASNTAATSFRKIRAPDPIPNLAERPVLRSEMLRLLLWSHHGDFRFWP